MKEIIISRQKTGFFWLDIYWVFRIAGPVFVAAILGIWSAFLAVQAGSGFGRVDIGPWRNYPNLGSFELDPYARAAIIRRNEWPLGLGEGQFFSATSDSDGLPLHSRCNYTLYGTLPVARAWTLAAHKPDGGLQTSQYSETYLTSGSVHFLTANAVEIRLASTVQSGNWLALPDDLPFTLVLRLYDPSNAIATTSRVHADFPVIVRGQCR